MDGDSPSVPLRRIITLFRPYRGSLTVIILLIISSALASLIPPFLLREILDVALPDHRIGLLSWLAIGMLTATLATTAVSVAETYLSYTVGQRVMSDLRIAVYSHLQRMSMGFFTATRSGEIQSRIANDIGAMDATVTNTAGTVVASLTTVIASLCAMLALSWRLTAVSLLVLPLFVWISSRVGEERRTLARQKQEQLAKMSVLVEESLSVNGFLLSRLVGRQQALNKEFAAQSSEIAALAVRANMAGRWRNSNIRITMAAMPVAIYWVTGVTAGHDGPGVSIGTLVVFASLQQSLFNPAIVLLQTGIALQSSMALFTRVFEYLDLPIAVREPSRPRPLPRPRGHLRFESVDFCYDEEPVLHDIDIDLPPGARLAVVGATGSGKTTLAYLVPRLYDVTGGRVTIDGMDVRDLGFATLAATVGMVNQDTYLFHSTVAENLRFAKADATHGELIEAATAAQIHDLIAGLPDGYETIVGEHGYRFSGGEKQRLAIARVMLRDPRVLILDEATSALDTRTEHAVRQALDVLSTGRTTLTIAHRLSTVRNADRIIVLDHGRIVERGTHESLLAHDGHYAALLHAGSSEDSRAGAP